MKPYLVEVKDSSSVSDTIKQVVAGGLPGSLESSINESQLIKTTSVRPKVHYVFSDEHPPGPYVHELLVDEAVQRENEHVKKVVVVEIDDKEEITSAKQYNIDERETSQLSNVAIGETRSGNCKKVTVETTEAQLRGLEKTNHRMNYEATMRMIEIFDRRNHELLSVLRQRKD
ncbi:Piso0_002154 [Millerozyma farinosa CBS 7064]|uniref:Piso0_002154 protein n=1 Tax=Pichia sorbitophila (strain ATCC MYA-4447 / BCRC 22081 / CBS 7064 / NBRC 10061 / NRRL Y-12695) TaxID=559304 RepID=G8YBU7_PICSO|nr:Piso0_002154 [Millerozyma farinosa CBS 7064]